MKTTPRLFALLIALCLLFALLPLQAFAEADDNLESGSFGDGFSYVYNIYNAFLILRGEGALPSFSEDDPAPWADHAAQIRRVILDEGITDIPEGAFSDCVKLNSVVFPTSIEVIEEGAFPCSLYFTVANTVGDTASLRRLLKESGVYPTVTRLAKGSLINEVKVMENENPISYYNPIDGSLDSDALREELKWRAWLDELDAA
ncbi:MAG: leucine-rich repeat domain-containing protein [Oscillospiraceae bacterium]|nr:leucine-rich repeat domain-containing protein [Oscillospiraceae bacterium]